MKPHQFTHKQQRYIRNNYLRISSNDLGKYCNCTGQIVRRWLKENGLIVPKEVTQSFRTAKLTGKTTFTSKEDLFIKKEYLNMPVKTLASAIKRSHTGVELALKRLGLVIPRELIEQRKADSRIKSGSTPPNKGKKQSEYMSAEAIARTATTRFKKGDIPLNAYDTDGIITIRNDHPERGGNAIAYKYIRLKLGKWTPLHTHVWGQVNGKVPKGHCLWFKDGDSMNCEIENLELITRKENIKRNCNHDNPSDKRIAFYMATQSRQVNKDLQKEILKHPELITAKRTQLLINRKIRKHGTEQNCRP